MFLLYIVVAVCLVFVVFIRVIVALGVGCRIPLSYFYSLSFDTSNENIELRTTLTKRTEPNRTNRVKVHPRWLKIQGISHRQRSTDTNLKSEARTTMNEKRRTTL